MDGSDVIIEQLHVASSDLKGRRAVAEDPLQRENIASVRQECPGEAVTQDMWGAPCRDLRGTSQTANEQLDAARRKNLAAAADEQRRVALRSAAGHQPSTQRSAAPATDRDDPFLRTLADDAAATFDQIEVANPEAHKLAQADAGVEQKQDDGAVSYRVARSVSGGSDEGAHLALPEALDEDIGQLWERQARKRMGVKGELPLDPTPKGAKCSHSPRHRVRSERPRAGCLNCEQPPPTRRGGEIVERRRPAVATRETDELIEVAAVPVDRATATAADLERNAVFINEVPKWELAWERRPGRSYGSHVCSSR